MTDDELKDKISSGEIDPVSYRTAMYISLNRICKVALREEATARETIDCSREQAAKQCAKSARESEKRTRDQIDFLNSIITTHTG